jgi:hypothetical protein
MSGLGVFTVYSPVATTETLTATSATYSGTGIANVTVNTNEVATGVPVAVPATFAVPVSADTNMTPLYPYSNTVFPLGLAAPTVQWDNKNTPATYVKISLRYPRAPAAQLFNWSIVLNGEPDGPVITGPYAHAPRTRFRNTRGPGSAAARPVWWGNRRSRSSASWAGPYAPSRRFR